jgi:hypothetical protein
MRSSQWVTIHSAQRIKDRWGNEAMSAATIDRVRHRAIGTRSRWFLTRVLAASLVASLCMAPVMTAFADQVLEVPQMTAPAASAPDAAPGAPAHHSYHEAAPRREAMAPMPANLGTLADYTHQDAEDAPSTSYSRRYSSSGFGGQAAGFGGPGGNFGGANLQFDPGNDRQALTNNLILGALALGLFALEVQDAHHRHHR